MDSMFDSLSKTDSKQRQNGIFVVSANNIFLCNTQKNSLSENSIFLFHRSLPLLFGEDSVDDGIGNCEFRSVETLV